MEAPMPQATPPAVDAEVAQKLMQQVMVRSATDIEFRQRLLDDPRAALAEHGCELPAGVHIQFVENRHDVTIVLPDPVEGAETPEPERQGSGS